MPLKKTIYSAYSKSHLKIKFITIDVIWTEFFGSILNAQRKLDSLMIQLCSRRSLEISFLNKHRLLIVTLWKHNQ